MKARERNCSGMSFWGVGVKSSVLSLVLDNQSASLSCQRLETSLVLAVALPGQRPQMSQVFRAWILLWFLVTSAPFTQQPTEHNCLEAMHGQVPHWFWGHAWNPTPDPGLKRRVDSSWEGGQLDLTQLTSSCLKPSRVLLTPRQRLSAAAYSCVPRCLCGASACFLFLQSVL